MLAAKSIPTFLLFILVSAILADFEHDSEEFEDDVQDDEYIPAAGSGPIVENTLKLVQILFRHGERTPVEQLPTSLYNESHWYPMGFGQLTHGGKRQAYDLGEFLRSRYRNYLSPQYVPKEIYVRSTDYDRTLSTAQLVLAALYIPVEGEVWNKNLPYWQPIPVHTAPAKVDFLLSTKIPCPKWNGIVNNTVNSIGFKNIEVENREFIKFTLEKSGYHKYYPDYWDVFDDLYSENTLGIPFPNWVNPTEFPKIEHLAYKIVEAMFVLNGVSRFKSGVLLNHMVENMKEKVQKKDEFLKKMFVFAAHDMNTLSFFGTLGINLHHFSPTTATIMVELHEIRNKHYVKILYRNSTAPPYTIPIPRCGRNSPEYCPLKLFTRITAPNRIADLPKACALDDEN